MTVSRNTCTVNVEIDPEGTAITFKSEGMRALLEEQAKRYAEEKTERGTARLKGAKPFNGMFGYHMKKGRYTWMAIIVPKNRAAWNVGRKYGTDNL